MSRGPDPSGMDPMRQEALAALRLLADWGADEALDEAPRRRLAGSPAPQGLSEAPLRGLEAPVWASIAAAPAAPESAPVRPAQSAPVPRAPVARTTAGASKAQRLANGCETRESLRETLQSFSDCPLQATATNLVFSDGNPDAGLVLVGEAPGEEEDRTGRPFCGASGQLLDQMLASIGLDRSQCLITNVIPWRPPGNRMPSDSELAMCLPFLLRHLTLLAPRLIVSLGGLACSSLSGTSTGITRMRGQWRELKLDGLATPVPHLPMLHPAYLLRTPRAKRDAWADLLALRARLDKL